jgi:hypothetical protein
VLRHKWHVFYAGIFLGVPLWRLLIHDWTKFSRAEWGPYVQRFYGARANPRDTGQGYMHEQGEDTLFDEAWRHHWTRNPHHWNYWRTPEQEDGTREALPMPETYVREMVADWYGAGMAQGKPDIEGWYCANVRKMQLHPETRKLTDRFITEAVLSGVIRP